MTRKEFEAKRDTLNEQLDAVTCELDDFAAAVRDHFDEKSEKWQEGEKGQAFAEMADACEEYAGECGGIRDNVGGLEWPA